MDKITLGAVSGDVMRVSYAYFIVTYTLAAAADNATFFGTNF